MADIFLSYTEADRATVRRLAETLQSAGWTVWWDRRIPAGLTWRTVLERELQQMRCMVVLWSQQSVQSDWVCEEAAEGRQLGRLVPVLIERVRPPAGFREIQAADLVDWDGSRGFGGLERLLEDIERLIGRPVPAPERGAGTAASNGAAPSRGPALPTARASLRKPWAWAIAAVALVAFIAVAGRFGATRPDAATDRAPRIDQAAPAAAAGPEPVTPLRRGPFGTRKLAEEVSEVAATSGCKVSVVSESDGHYVVVQC